MNDNIELETKEAQAWVNLGALKLESIGNENLYFKDEFNRTYYVKDLTVKIPVYDVLKAM